MMIFQLRAEYDDAVQNVRWSIDVLDNVPKDDVDDASSLLPMMLGNCCVPCDCVSFSDPLYAVIVKMY